MFHLVGRIVEREILDDLPAADPQAVGSRADIRRLNFIMGHAGILSNAFCDHLAETSYRLRPLWLVELGAGDGTLLLKLAQRWSALGVTARVTLLDRQFTVSDETKRGFAELNWTVESTTADVFTWLEESSATADLILANLFLHHFQDTLLTALLRLAASRTKLFIACEPRRSALALTASRLTWFIGCNETTRHDAVASVRAGFRGRELSSLWPSEPATREWKTSEQSAGLFSHSFIAKRSG